MQNEYLSRLSAPLQHFVLITEERSGLKINVVEDAEQNTSGPNGDGGLAITIHPQKIRIYAPTNGYFPDGAVRHEVLHVERFHVECVLKIVLSDSVLWDAGFAEVLGALDNAIEHIIIVPKEIELHPERREHWEAIMRNICAELPYVPEDDLRLAVCLHWAFLTRVLPGSMPFETLKQFAQTRGLFQPAEKFANEFLSASNSKEQLVHILFSNFPEIPRDRSALEYINSMTGYHQTPIP